MKSILISVLALFLVGSVAIAQHRGDAARSDAYVPTSLDGATSFAALTMNTSLDDTTKTIDLRGFTYGGMTLDAGSATGNDSVGVLFSISASADGVNWSAYTVIDSVINRTTTVRTIGAIAFPDKYLAFNWVRVRVYDSADAGFGANTAATLTFKVVRKY